MKLLLKILCILAALYCFYFPFTYFNSTANVKELKVSHILVDSEDKAVQIREDIIAKNIKFEEAAKKYSECESAKDGGDIGYNTMGMLYKEIEQAALALGLYKLSDPIKTEAGWHLIRVTDVKHFSDKNDFAKLY